MCVAIATAVLPPHHQALLQVLEQSCASMYIETAGSILFDDGKDRVPCILPLPADVGVLVVRVSDVLVTGDIPVGPITRLRYTGTPLRYPGGWVSFLYTWRP